MNKPTRLGPPCYCPKCEERVSWLRLLPMIAYMRCESPFCGHTYAVELPTISQSENPA